MLVICKYFKKNIDTKSKKKATFTRICFSAYMLIDSCNCKWLWHYSKTELRLLLSCWWMHSVVLFLENYLLKKISSNKNRKPFVHIYSTLVNSFSHSPALSQTNAQKKREKKLILFKKWSAHILVGAIGKMTVEILNSFIKLWWSWALENRLEKRFSKFLSLYFTLY